MIFCFTKCLHPDLFLLGKNCNGIKTILIMVGAPTMKIVWILENLEVI